MPAEPAPDVQVAPSVMEKLERLAEESPQQADSVARAITSDVDRIGTNGEPIRIDVPKGPPGAKYYAVTPAHPDAPGCGVPGADGPGRGSGLAGHGTDLAGRLRQVSACRAHWTAG